MFSQHIWILAFLTVCVAAQNANVEILSGDVSDSFSEENFMEEEELLPVSNSYLSSLRYSRNTGIEKERVKRQANPSDDTGSGDGTIYTPVEAVASSFTIRQTTEFRGNFTGVTDQQIINQAQAQLNGIFGPTNGALLATVTGVERTPTGIKLVWTIAATDSPVQGNPNALFSSGNRKDFEDNLKNMLNTLGPSFMGNLNINGFNPQTQLNPTQIATDAGAQVQDPCSSPDACPLGYENCRTVGFGDSTCSHKCEKFEEDRACEHGSLCELDANNEPFCSCGKNWEGKYCENDRNRLDPGEITGIVLGAMAMCIGLMGCCCWFLICRKRSQKHLKYTHYSDDLNGNDNFSNPSSKLTNYVIARPAVSVDPIQVFQPSAPPPDAFSVA